MESQRIVSIKKDMTAPIVGFWDQKISINSILKNLEPQIHEMIGDSVSIELRLADNINFISVAPHDITEIVKRLLAIIKDDMKSGGKLIIETANIESFIDSKGSQKSEVMLAVSYMKAERVSFHYCKDRYINSDEQDFEETVKNMISIARLVNQAGGEIKLYNHVLSGKTFRINFPVKGDVPKLPHFTLNQYNIKKEEIL